MHSGQSPFVLFLFLVFLPLSGGASATPAFLLVAPSRSAGSGCPWGHGCVRWEPFLQSWPLLHICTYCHPVWEETLVYAELVLVRWVLVIWGACVFLAVNFPFSESTSYQSCWGGFKNPLLCRKVNCFRVAQGRLGFLDVCMQGPSALSS